MTISVVLLSLALQVASTPVPTPAGPAIEYRECQFCHEIVAATPASGGRYIFKDHEFLVIRTGRTTGYQTCIPAVVHAFKRLGVGRDIELPPPSPDTQK